MLRHLQREQSGFSPGLTTQPSRSLITSTAHAVGYRASVPRVTAVEKLQGRLSGSDFPALLGFLDQHAEDCEVFQLTATMALRMNLPVFSQAAEHIGDHLALCEERIHAAPGRPPALPSGTSLPFRPL